MIKEIKGKYIYNKNAKTFGTVYTRGLKNNAIFAFYNNIKKDILQI